MADYESRDQMHPKLAAQEQAEGSVREDVSPMLTVDQIHEIFEFYANFGRSAVMTYQESLDSFMFMKFARECPGLLGGGLTRTEVDLIFTKAKPKFERRLNFEHFLDALSAIAERKFPECSPADGLRLMVAQHLVPHYEIVLNEMTKTGDTEVPLTGIYKKLYDVRSYTGVYAERFRTGDGRINGDTETRSGRTYMGNTNTATDEIIHDISVLMRPNLHGAGTMMSPANHVLMRNTGATGRSRAPSPTLSRYGTGAGGGVSASPRLGTASGRMSVGGGGSIRGLRGGGYNSGSASGYASPSGQSVGGPTPSSTPAPGLNFNLKSRTGGGSAVLDSQAEELLAALSRARAGDGASLMALAAQLASGSNAPATANNNSGGGGGGDGGGGGSNNGHSAEGDSGEPSASSAYSPPGKYASRPAPTPTSSRAQQQQQRYRSSSSPRSAVSRPPPGIASASASGRYAQQQQQQQGSPPAAAAQRFNSSSRTGGGGDGGSVGGYSTAGGAPALSEEQLHEIFEFYANFGRSAVMTYQDSLDSFMFMKFARECPGLLGGGLTRTEVDLIFTKAKPKMERRLDFTHFLDALSAIAERKYPECAPADGLRLLLAQHLVPHYEIVLNEMTKTGDTEVPLTGIYKKLYDVRSYTGVYAERFRTGDGRINGDADNRPGRTYMGNTNTATDEIIHDISVLMRPNLRSGSMMKTRPVAPGGSPTGAWASSGGGSGSGGTPRSGSVSRSRRESLRSPVGGATY